MPTSLFLIWPVGQAVKTAASHAVNVGSIPARVIKNHLSLGSGDFFVSVRGIEQHGRPQAAKNSPVDCFLVRGRFPHGSAATCCDLEKNEKYACLMGHI